MMQWLPEGKVHPVNLSLSRPCSRRGSRREDRQLRLSPWEKWSWCTPTASPAEPPALPTDPLPVSAKRAGRLLSVPHVPSQVTGSLHTDGGFNEDQGRAVGFSPASVSLHTFLVGALREKVQEFSSCSETVTRQLVTHWKLLTLSVPEFSPEKTVHIPGGRACSRPFSLRQFPVPQELGPLARTQKVRAQSLQLVIRGKDLATGLMPRLQFLCDISVGNWQFQERHD